MPDMRFERVELRELTWGWWLALLLGVLSLIAGIIVILKPSNSLATLAVITGIGLICYGLSLLALGWAMHAVRREAEAAPGGSA